MPCCTPPIGEEVDAVEDGFALGFTADIWPAAPDEFIWAVDILCYPDEFIWVRDRAKQFPAYPDEFIWVE